MEIKARYNELSSTFIKKIQATGLFNLSLYLILMSFFAGFLFGIVEFIERNYATHYHLNFLAKIQGALYAGAWMSLYTVCGGIIIAGFVTLTLFILLRVGKYLELRNASLNLIWIVIAAMYAVVATIIVYYFYFSAAESDFTRYFLFNTVIKTVTIYNIGILKAFFIAGFVAIYLNSYKKQSLMKSFLILFGSLAIIFSVLIYALNKQGLIFWFVAKEYEMLTGLFESNLVLFVGLLYIFFLLFGLVLTYILVYFLPAGWKYNVFKGFAGLALFGLFAFFYLFMVNYLPGQTFYISSIGNLHHFTGSISLLYFYLLMIYIAYFASFTPYTLNRYRQIYISSGILSCIIIAMLFMLYLKPRTDMLKAFIPKSAVLQQNFNLRIFYPLMNIKRDHLFILPEKSVCMRHREISTDFELKTKPDIFLISFDALRTDYALNKQVAPNLNAFFEGAYTFENNYSPATHTPASMSCISVSRYFAGTASALHPTLASILVENGYQTRALLGINLANPKLVLDKTILNDVEYPSPIIKGYEEVSIPRQESDNTDEKIYKQVLKTINRRNPDQPLLVWWHIYQVHETPVAEVFKNFVSNQSFKNEYNRRLKNADQLFGDYIQYLKQNKLYDNSIIVVFSDHGEEIKEHSSFFHTFSLYNELIRVPLAIKLPGQNRGKMIQTPVSTIDMNPTILNYLGISPRQFNFCGQSLLPFLKTGSIEFVNMPLSAFYRGYFYYGEGAKKIPSATQMTINPAKFQVYRLYKVSIVDKQNKWKLIYSMKPDPAYYELYNLQEDPEETTNLADKHPDIVSKLILEMDRQIK
jgi:MFS family permease